MNLNTKNAKNLVSKDKTLSETAAIEILNNCDFESFKVLCENSTYLYDFIIKKIINNLLLATNNSNIKATFEFAKIYNEQIGEYINQCWLKYANEDLTDKILELFEIGTDEQKIYAAKYFEKINDPLSIEYLRKYAFSKNEELSIASAKTLGIFQDNDSRNKALIMLNSDDEFVKFDATRFLINYGNINDIPKIIQTLDISAFSSNIAQEILYKYDFNMLKNILNDDEILTIYDEIISAYPEDIGLETVQDFNLAEFAKNFANKKSSFVVRVLTDIKNIIELVSKESIYTYDLDKEHLCSIKALNVQLKDLLIDTDLIANELNKSQKRVQRAINTIINLKDKRFNEKITELYSLCENSLIICECARAAKNLNINIDKNIGLNKISDKNALELFKSYF